MNYLAASVLAVFLGCASTTTTKESENRAERVESAKEIARRHLETTNRWARSEYRVEFQSFENGRAVVRGIHLDDEQAPVESDGKRVLRYGGGKSVLLYIDLSRQVVTDELEYQ